MSITHFYIHLVRIIAGHWVFGKKQKVHTYPAHIFTSFDILQICWGLDKKVKFLYHIFQNFWSILDFEKSSSGTQDLQYWLKIKQEWKIKVAPDCFWFTIMKYKNNLGLERQDNAFFQNQVFSRLRYKKWHNPPMVEETKPKKHNSLILSLTLTRVIQYLFGLATHR